MDCINSHIGLCNYSTLTCRLFYKINALFAILLVYTISCFPPQYYCDMKHMHMLNTHRQARVCRETTEVCGITIPKDMNIIVPLHYLHRIESIWGDPDIFRPER